MVYEHYFICVGCNSHVKYRTVNSTAVQPGRTHSEALKNGGVPGVAHPPAGGPGCMGTLTFCSGMHPRSLAPCAPAHSGTAVINDPPAPPTNPVWDNFANHVTATWNLYVANAYALAFRGPNHDRAFPTAPAVFQVLQNSGGVVTIGGALYTVSISLTTDASLHRYPAGHATFVYHL